MIILIPFELLKLRRVIEKSRTPENLNALQHLINHDILEAIQLNLDAGNITVKRELSHTVDPSSPLLVTTYYTYGNSNWGDLLTEYDGHTITYDTVGNPLSDGTWTYTWEHGRELIGMTDLDTTITYDYNADGLRIKKTVDGVVHNYVYSGGKLVEETYGDTKLNFSYDANGNPYTFSYTKGDNSPSVYHYVLNLQGDVVRIVTDDGITVVTDS